jgi:hypothetical protein
LSLRRKASDGDGAGVAVGGDEARDQRDRHVVDGFVAQVLEGAQRRAFTGAGDAGNQDDMCFDRRGLFRAHLRAL